MADYHCRIRTNYFHVTDESKFRALMARVYGTEAEVELWEDKDEVGNLVFAFGSQGGIGGLRNSADDEDLATDESSYDEFIDGLQACVADGDAILLMEAGYEKLCYLQGTVMILTSTACKCIDFIDLAKKEAQKLLRNPNWESKCQY